MTNVISIKRKFGEEIQDFLNAVKSDVVDFGILGYRYPSGTTEIIEISNGDITDTDIIELLEHLVESMKNPQEIELR